jgi:predicted GTPase
MNRDPWGLEALTRRIAMVAPADPCSPANETSAQLTRIHRELADAVGPDEARERFDRALLRAVTDTLAARPAPFTPAA